MSCPFLSLNEYEKRMTEGNYRLLMVKVIFLKGGL